MTITLKDKDSVWVAVSASGMPYTPVEDLIHEDNIQIWRVPGVQNCVMASLRAGGIDLDRIRYEKSLGLNRPLSMSMLLLKTLPKLKQILLRS